MSAPASELRLRVLSAAVLVPVFAAAVLFLPAPWLALLLGTVVLLGAWEWGGIVLPGSQRSRIVFTVTTAILMVVVWFASGDAVGQTDVGGTADLLRGAVIWWVVALLLLVAVQLGAQPRLLDSLPVRFVTGWLTLVPGWFAMIVLQADVGARTGAALLCMMAIVWGADVGAYFVGRRVGGAKLAPRISPGKTWSGFAGGVAGGVVVAAMLAAWAGGGRGVALVAAIGALTVLASVVGDLFESLMKRRAGIKDSGHLIPGHGGVLDRIDSLTAAGPVFALLLYITRPLG